MLWCPCLRPHARSHALAILSGSGHSTWLGSVLGIFLQEPVEGLLDLHAEKGLRQLEGGVLLGNSKALALSVQRKECVMKFSRYSKHLDSVLSILGMQHSANKFSASPHALSVKILPSPHISDSH